MRAVFRKEIASFFASSTAYLIIGLFLLLNGLFLWVFSGPYNIFEYGFADLSKFFLLAPWVFLFLIPAICMRSFSEEIKLGTLELIYIKPPAMWRIVSGKYLAAVTLSILAVLPTLIYVYSVSELGTTVGNLDLGQAMGSYLGLIFLIMTYAGISIFFSSLTDNQIVAFITALACCFLFFYVSEGLATLFTSGEASWITVNMGLKARFESMAQGVIDTRDVISFLSISALFLYMTSVQLKNRAR